MEEARSTISHKGNLELPFVCLPQSLVSCLGRCKVWELSVRQPSLLAPTAKFKGAWSPPRGSIIHSKDSKDSLEAL